MNHYLDLRLRPDPEIATSHLLSAVYGKLHLALVSGNHCDIGVSFPRSGESAPLLGDTLRLHGSESALSRLQSLPWLGHLAEHVAVTSIREVPSATRYRTMRRVQVKSSPERLRRRYVRRHGVSQEEALILIPDSTAQVTDLPFLRLRSGSNGKDFRLFIHQGDVQSQPASGTFNSYGLGDGATVPWF